MINYKGNKFSGYNKPKATPGESKKSAVLAKENGKVKLVIETLGQVLVLQSLVTNENRHL